MEKLVSHLNNNKQPITLIIGENGFGKTSFINSIKLALYMESLKTYLQIGARKTSNEIKNLYARADKDKTLVEC